MMKINHNPVRLRALAVGGYLQGCAIRQFACSTDYVEKAVKSLCFGVIRTHFYLIFFYYLGPPPQEDPCFHCLGVKGVTPSGFPVIETDPRLPNLSQSQSDALISLQLFLCLVRHWPDHCTL